MRESATNKGINAPDKYVSNAYSYTTSGVTQKSFTNAINTIFAPYYINNDPFTLDTLNTSAALGTISGITVNNVDVAYDGEPHSASVTVPDGAVLSYSTNEGGGDGAAYTAQAPAYTNPGTYTDAYRVTMPGYETVYGTVTVMITKTNGNRTALENKTVDYNGAYHSLGELEKLDGDTITYTYDGIVYDTMPEFSQVGQYKVTVKATNPLYTTYTQTVTLTINRASLESATISGAYEGPYDGANHNVSVSGIKNDVTVEYSLNGGEWTKTKPANFNAVTDGAQTVAVRLSGANYYERTETLTFNITPADITDVTLTPATGLVETGNALSLATVAGTVTGDTVQYALNGGAFSNTAPTVTRAGTYTVAVKVTRANYADKILVTNATVAAGQIVTPEVFALTVNSATVTEGETTSTFKWNLGLAFGADAAEAETADFKVLSYGIKYAASEEVLSDFIFYKNYANATAADKLVTDGKVAEIAYDEFETGVTTLYATNTLYVTNTAPQRARYAAFYIRYQIGDTVYEQFSDVQSISNLPGSVVGGNETVAVTDIFVA
ncbi:MAG: hypothetical protein IJN42_06450 [Clostridia bacterium]|nr:hypothetical protein [Clostridia bacterium]